MYNLTQFELAVYAQRRLCESPLKVSPSCDNRSNLYADPTTNYSSLNSASSPTGAGLDKVSVVAGQDECVGTE